MCVTRLHRPRLVHKKDFCCAINFIAFSHLINNKTTLWIFLSCGNSDPRVLYSNNTMCQIYIIQPLRLSFTFYVPITESITKNIVMCCVSNVAKKDHSSFICSKVRYLFKKKNRISGGQYGEETQVKFYGD